MARSISSSAFGRWGFERTSAREADERFRRRSSLPATARRILAALIGLIVLAPLAHGQAPGIKDEMAVQKVQIPNTLIASVSVGVTPWDQIPGSARDIGVPANGGAVWIVGTLPEPGGFGIYARSSDGKNWLKRPGGATSIAAGPDGDVWVTNDQQQIYRWVRAQQTWERMPGAAYDIGIGANGSVWIVGTKAYPVGFAVYHWNGQGWDEIEGAAAARIAVGPDGGAWIIDLVGRLFEYRGGRLGWREHDQIPSKELFDVGVGGDGEVWVLSGPMGPGGGSLHRYDGTEWRFYPGAAVRVSVDSYGEAWAANDTGSIYRTTCSVASYGRLEPPARVGVGCLKQPVTGRWTHDAATSQLRYSNTAWPGTSNPWNIRDGLCLAGGSHATQLESCAAPSSRAWQYRPDQRTVQATHSTDAKVAGRCLAYAGRGLLELIGCDDPRAAVWSFE